ncbi:YdcF family protein [Bacillus sp. BHET2]|uniref:YdcF family protein n=1 Tax=Bacillus sp. BHET2 TaxID=2583818 RepID=UPI00110F4945|nr:YdcF family protein [Bacillus sp. BHET2]TMU87560.1 YdcF family protein [Bacillus sp. BHET2]
MKPIIPREPIVPDLNQGEVEFLTSLTFGMNIKPRVCDALFVFSGTHSGHWEKAIEAYEKGYIQKIIVTGGRSLTGVPHPEWEGNQHEECSEADIIISHLRQAGIPSHQIVYEDTSTNSLENVLYAKEVFDFTSIESLMVVCKSHVTGRQLRTLKKHLPKRIEYIPYTFTTTYRGIEVNRDNWMTTDSGRKRAWGEYLRIEKYGKMGHLQPM